MKKKVIALVLACVMCVGIGIGGTLAWLKDSTPAVTNTFTAGDINLDLKEHEYNPDTKLLTDVETVTNDNYTFVPGDTLPKDPFVKVLAKSEACWLFVKVEETNNTRTDLTGKIIDWSVIDTDTKASAVSGATKWTKLADEDVWYIQVSAAEAEAGKTYPVLANQQVTVNENVTKEMINEAQTGIETLKPSLKFTAYAIQSANLKDSNGNQVTTAAAAWALAKPLAAG